jgi:hypothetical protein
MNLVSNALNFTKNGKITIKVKKIQLNCLQYLAVSVEDTGCGIEELKLKGISNVFKSNDFKSSESHLKKGVGLSLIISHNIVKQFQGLINVESHPGRGSLFVFNFRVYSENEIDPEESEILSSQGSETEEEKTRANIFEDKKFLRINNQKLIFFDYNNQRYVRNLDLKGTVI